MGNMTIKQEFSIGDRVIIKGGNQLFGKILKINKKQLMFKEIQTLNMDIL